MNLSEVRRRLQLVAEKAREVAAECEQKKVFDFGVYNAFDDEGHPCCPWGHVMSRAGFKPPGRYATNSAALWDFVLDDLGHYVANHEGPADPKLRKQHATWIFVPLVDVARQNDNDTVADDRRLYAVRLALTRTADALEKVAATV